MTTSGPTTYRYIADGALGAGLQAYTASQLRKPLVWVSLVGVGLLLGIGLSLATNVASLPDYLGRVLLIGVVWGLAWSVGVAVLVGALVVPLVRVINRRTATRLFPTGSVTEVELGEDALVITRPNRTRAVPYRAIFRVQPRGAFWGVVLRGQLKTELLPIEMLPLDAVELIRTRARDVWPVTTLGEGNSHRQVVVPDGWAAHAAAVYTRSALHRGDFWRRVGLALLVSTLLALVAGTWWLIVAPVWVLVSGGTTYLRTRRVIATALPTGSLATTEFFEDRFISRNAGGVREVPFDDIRLVDVQGDVVLLVLASKLGTLTIARALLPDDRLQQLRT